MFAGNFFDVVFRGLRRFETALIASDGFVRTRQAK
jgi:hypothetical protein